MHLRGIVYRLGPSSLAARRSPLATRRGFTLIEMLVAMALTLFIMVILAEAFSTGIDSFSQLKAIGDMEENLRAAATSLRADLAADHFEGKRRLSDGDLYSNPPREGFFRIFRPAALPPNFPQIPIDEGVDADNIRSFRSGWHVIHMTVKRRGNNRQDFFSAAVPAGSPLLVAAPNPDLTIFFGQTADARMQDNGNTYSSQWVEVAYFLVPIGTTTDPNPPNPPDFSQPLPPGATPLFALYRVERVVVPDSRWLNTPVAGQAAPPIPNTAAGDYAQFSWRDTGNGILTFNNPSDLTLPANRSFYFPTAANPAGQPGNLTVPLAFTAAPGTPWGRGATLVMTNVVSFNVRALRSVPSPPESNQAKRIYTDPSFMQLNFDTGDPATIPTVPLTNGQQVVQFPAFLSAVTVTLRVWDQKTQQTRQISVMQDM
jgi:prepilin-type N-terminal cleavage/methylation domain-containing protein